MAIRGEDNSIPLDEVSRVLESGVSGADPLRVQGLEQLHRVRNIKATSLVREQARLSEKLGADHPRVLELSQQIEANRVLTSNLSVEIQRSKTDIPKADENTWILHGHVLNSKLRGVPNLTVAVYDQRGRWIELLGYACTDRDGHFLFSYTASEARANELTNIIGAASTQQNFVFVHVLDRRGFLLHADKRPISPHLGQVDYIRIILGEDASSCKPPRDLQREASEQTSTPPETENPS